jgi:hypothetical protein
VNRVEGWQKTIAMRHGGRPAMTRTVLVCP